MAYFKIRNITNTLGKRHPRFNTPQIVETKNLIGVNQTSIHPGTEIILECEYLPVSAQQLRMKGFVIVEEINKTAYLKTLKAQEERNAAAKVAKPVKVAEPQKTEEKPKKNFVKEKQKFN